MMKIALNGQMRVYQRGKLKFEAWPKEIDSVLAMGGRAFEPPSILSWLPKRPAVLQFILVVAGAREVTIANHDRGFNEALTWLTSQGWRIDEARKLAVDQPYVRQAVGRSA